MVPIENRFLESFTIGEKNECWEWNKSRLKWGYGRFWIKPKNVLAHRYSYEYFNGVKPPENLLGCHTCDNPPCINPNHLFLGTDADNVHDSQRKGNLPTVPHPSFYTYKMGCRCDECKRLKSDYSRRNYLAKKLLQSPKQI